MRKFFTRKTIDKVFEIGVLIKFFFGLFEILAGILLAISGRLITDNFIISLAQQEIAEDPNDLIANYLINLSGNLAAGAHFFAIFYLLFHGVVNIFLVITLLKSKIWGYPWIMAGFSYFIIYQTYRYFHTHSLMLLFLTAFDIFVVTIIYLEYRSKIRKLKNPA